MKFLSLTWLGWLIVYGALAQQVRNPVQLRSLQDEQTGQVTLLARNPGHCPYQVRISFAELTNYQADQPLPHHAVLAPDDVEVVLLRLKPAQSGRGSSYQAQYALEIGDPALVPDTQHVYLLPFAHGTAHLVSQGYMGDYSHRGKYALDFDMPVGTPVMAMRDGVIIEAKTNSDRGGAQPRFATDGNYVLIYHPDGTFAAYSHLRKNGLARRVGERVEAGEVIAYSGNTGWSQGPHLHVEISRVLPMATQTIPARFLRADGRAVTLREREKYHAYHPGQPPFAPPPSPTRSEASGKSAVAPPPDNNQVEIVERNTDGGRQLLARNGLPTPVVITLRVKPQNLRLSPAQTRRFEVPARTEQLLLTAEIADPRKPAQLEYSYQVCQLDD